MNATFKAVLWMMGAVGAFTMMAIAGRFAGLAHDTFEIMLFRSIIGIVLVLTVARAAGTHTQITRRRLDLHLIRNVSHFAGQNLWFYALTLIPLAQLFALEFTTPIWVMLLAPLVVGEALTRLKLFCAALGFTGILIVIYGPGLTGLDTSALPDPATTTQSWTASLLNSLNPGTIAALLAAVGFAGSVLYTKKLTRSESTTCILFWLTVMQAVMGLICAGYDGQIKLPTSASLPWLVVIGFCGLIAHFCLTTALTFAPASVVMPMDFLRLPVIIVVGALMFNEHVELIMLVGAAAILTANYINIASQARQS